MSNKARKARKRQGIQLERTPKQKTPVMQRAIPRGNRAWNKRAKRIQIELLSKPPTAEEIAARTEQDA